MLPGLLRSRVAILCGIVLVLIILLVSLANQQDLNFTSITDGLGVWGASSIGSDEAVRRFYLKHLNAPSVAVDAPTYKPYGAFEWKLDENINPPRWQAPLGKKLCIFDLDNRPFEDDGQVFGQKPMSWNDADMLHGLSLGVCSIGSTLHGYQYYYVRTGEFEDRRGSWKKPSILGRVLQKHETCVYVDSDAIFNHIDLPLEWLMNYWKIDKNNNSLALSIDPKAEHNKDKKGKVYDNTGFIIAQNRPITFEMMKDWAECADDGGKHPECTEYRTVAFGRPSDQGGFGNFIRYDYANDVMELPCSEANGFPEDRSECLGTFIKHLWSGKADLIKIAVGQMLPGSLLEIFHRAMLADKPNFYFTEEELMNEAWLKKHLRS